jgi:predicted nucleotidyltransferase
MDFLKPTTLKVLEFFFTHPAVEFHEREVLRGAGISKGSANKILRELAGLAILRRTEKGRMVFYRLNASDPFVKQMKILSNVWALRPFVQGLGESARKVILFGSCAEGTDVGESDIDVLILTDEKRRAKERVSSFNRKSERQIAPVIVDMEEFTRMKKEDRPLFERIDRGIALWETA